MAGKTADFKIPSGNIKRNTVADKIAGGRPQLPQHNVCSNVPYYPAFFVNRDRSVV